MSTIVEIAPTELHGSLVFRATLEQVINRPTPDGFADWTFKHRAHWIESSWAPISDWFAGLGLQMATALTVFRRGGDGHYLIAVLERVTDDRGFPMMQHADADGDLLTYRVVDAGADLTWPDEFNDPRYTEKAGAWL